MKHFRTMRRSALPVLAVILCIALGAVAVLHQQEQPPDNPLAAAAAPSHMLLSGSGGSEGGAEALEAANGAAGKQTQQVQQNQEQTQQNTQTAEPPLLQTGLQSQQQTVPETDVPPTDGEEAGAETEASDEDGGGEENPALAGDTQIASGGETDKEYFTTSIRDGETVPERSYSFEIYHCDTALTVCSERVYVNGAEQPQFHGSVLLEQGENTVRVAVVYAGSDGKRVSVYRDYTLYVIQEEQPLEPTPEPTPEPAQPPSIMTTLADQTVHETELSFYAGIANGSGSARLTVVCNGKTITAGGDGMYHADLASGANTIRLKLTDVYNGEHVTINESYVVSYVPLATAETAPKLLYCNAVNGMSVSGTAFTLDLQPVDYEGNRIYYNGITVRLNGAVCSYTWASEYTSYLLYLENGSNTLDVRITDTEGRYSDYTYTINCTAVADGVPIGTVTISVDAAVLGIGEIIAPTAVTIYQGETAAEAVVRFLEENGIEETHSGSLTNGFYLSRISKTGICASVSIPAELVEEINRDGLEWKSQHYTDSLGEFDYCQGSGWMYSINGSFPGYGLSEAVFRDGDVVRIRYTLAYGKDIGGYASTGSGGANYEVIW